MAMEILREQPSCIAFGKHKGYFPDQWKEDLEVGATRTNGGVKLFIHAPTGWKGKIRFESLRHAEKMHMPVDYPRINQFQEWFTVDLSKKYQIKSPDKKSTIVSGKQLNNGWQLDVRPGETVMLDIDEMK